MRARVGIDPFRRRGALLVQLLHLLPRHAHAPQRHRDRIAAPRHRRGAAVLRRHHRRDQETAAARGLVEARVIDIAPVDEPPLGGAARPSFDLIEHRDHLPVVAAAGDDPYAHDHPRVDIGRELDVIARPKAPVAHLHDPRVGIGRRGPRGGRRPLPRFRRRDRGQVRERVVDPRQPLLRRAVLGRRLATRRRPVGWARRPRHLCAGGAQARLQRGLAPKRPDPGRRANPRPVLRHPRQPDHAAIHQRADRLRQQIVQLRRMLHPKIREGVVIHRHAPTHPPVRVVAIAQPVHLPRTAHAIDRGVQPQRDQNLRIDRRAPRAIGPRPDPLVEPAQVQAFHEVPDQSRRVARGQERLQVARLQLHLLTMGRFIPRRLDRLERPDFRRHGKQRVISHARTVVRFDPGRNPLRCARPVFSQALKGCATDTSRSAGL